eukprot:Amastigsp_a844799_3.p3 type:complete len:116 gc:universal Amastigsp_a844799_3:376-29(-)
MSALLTQYCCSRTLRQWRNTNKPSAPGIEQRTGGDPSSGAGRAASLCSHGLLPSICVRAPASRLSGSMTSSKTLRSSSARLRRSLAVPLILYLRSAARNGDSSTAGPSIRSGRGR